MSFTPSIAFDTIVQNAVEFERKEPNTLTRTKKTKGAVKAKLNQSRTDRRYTLPTCRCLSHTEKKCCVRQPDLDPRDPSIWFQARSHGKRRTWVASEDGEENERAAAEPLLMRAPEYEDRFNRVELKKGFKFDFKAALGTPRSFYSLRRVEIFQ